MGYSVVSSFLLLVLLFSLFQSPTEAAIKPYIVYLGSHSHGPNPSSVDLESVTSSHYSLLGSYLGSEEKAKDTIFYSYTRHINGFAAILDEEEASEIAKHPNVVSVFLSRERKLHTTRSWDFLNLERNGVALKNSIWKKARYGEDTIIGNLDTGVWPESKSFSDEGMGPIPSKWRGICQSGTTKYRVRCNRKLIGVRYFNKGYIAHLKTLNATFSPVRDSTLFTARDYEGHGTHTLSTAAGNCVPGANVFGNGNGTAKGGSPKARVAAYKVCWQEIDEHGCTDPDILAAFEAAITDGVDVLSASIGGEPQEFFEDATAIGAFHAIKKGIVVVTSAGNDGPGPGTVGNVAPWLVSVGASSIDREFISYVALGNRKHLKGASLSSTALPSQKFYPLISGTDAKAAKVSNVDAMNCKPRTLDPNKVKGKILLCGSGGIGRTKKGQQAVLAGAVGMILINGNDFIADAHVLPASHVNFNDTNLLIDYYVNSTKIPMAYLTRPKTEEEVKPAPLMAAFSSRGPNLVEPAILKPDIIAPGVNIIAAYTESVGPSNQPIDKRRISFNIDTGTSMACPHVSGIVGLLKTLHPDWSPAAIQSAIMTSARIADGNKKPILESLSMKKATPFAYGSGHIQPNRAMDPGLVYDLTFDDYLNFLCAHGYNEKLLKKFSNQPHKCSESFTFANFNYPSISVPSLGSQPVIVTRRVKNVGPPGTYTASVRAPAGVSVYVKPTSLKFTKTGEEKKFEIVLKAKIAGKPKYYVFGQLKWSDGKHYVRSPIAVKY